MIFIYRWFYYGFLKISLSCVTDTVDQFFFSFSLLLHKIRSVNITLESTYLKNLEMCRRTNCKTHSAQKRRKKKNENKILQEYIRQQQRDNEIHKNECDFGCSLSLYYVRGDIFLECCCCCGGGCCCIYILPC